jgi:DNA polymerase I
MAMSLFLQNLKKQKSVCFDTETTSLNPLEAELVGIAFSWEAGKGFYIPFPEDENEAGKLMAELNHFLKLKMLKKLGRTLKYDIKVLQNTG